MKMNKIAAAIGFAAAVSVAAPAMADTNRALEAWKTFAAEQKNPNYDAWVKAISDPKAIALAKEWKDLRGYDAYDLMDKVSQYYSHQLQNHLQSQYIQSNLESQSYNSPPGRLHHKE